MFSYVIFSHTGIYLLNVSTNHFQVISRTKTPQEIIEEYERLEKEREERRLNECTNPQV